MGGDSCTKRWVFFKSHQMLGSKQTFVRLDRLEWIDWTDLFSIQMKRKVKFYSLGR